MKTFTREEIAGMTDSEYEANRGDILSAYEAGSIEQDEPAEDPLFTRRQIAEMTDSEYLERRDEIMSAMAENRIS